MSRPLRSALVFTCLACTPSDEPAPAPEVPDIAYCDDVREWDPQWSAFELEVVALLDERRAAGASCGGLDYEPAGPLRMNPALRCAARKHALDMATRDYFSNLDPEGLDFLARALASEYEGTALEQNIGANHDTPEQLVTAVMDNIGLCEHVMAAEADEIGVGYLTFEGATYPSYWTHVFGRAP